MTSTPRITIRPAEAQHEKLLLEWANDPTTRAHALSTDEIGQEEHRRWFEETLTSDNRYQYVAIEDGEPVGQIRFDHADGAWEIDVSVAPSERGRGLGTSIIRAGVHQLERDGSEVDAIRAVVKQENTASIRAFERAGFTRVASEERRGTSIVVLELETASGVPPSDK